MHTNTTYPTPGGVDPEELDRHIADMYRDVANEAGGALADILTERRIATRTSCQADLWAACIAGASQRDRYLADIAAAGLELQVIQANPGYRFASERAQRSGGRCRAGGREDCFTNTTTTQEVTK